MATIPTETAVEPGEADDNVFREVLLHFEEIAVVDHGVDHILHVIRQIRLRGHDAVERGVGSVDWVSARLARRVVQVVGRHEAQQLAHHRQTLGVIVGEKVRHARGFVVGHRSAELLFGDFLVRHRFNYIGASDEHVGSLVDHEDEVGDRRRIDRASSAGAHDRGNLRDNSTI